MGPICGYYNECKKPTTIVEPICEYYIFKNGLMEFIIESGVGIICFKCVYCFKKFLGDVSLITLDVSITQCSFSSL
jgi:hypothetical protein